MMANASKTTIEALSIIRRIESGAHAAPILNTAAKGFSGSEMGRLTDLVYGVQRWRRLCDHIIEKSSLRNLSKIDPPVLNVLRCAVYQLSFSKRPGYAVVDEAVEIAKRKASWRSAPFVNAVLRKALTLQPVIDHLPSDEKPEYYLSIRYSHPEWLVTRWLKQFGRSTAEEILKSNQEIPLLTLLVNRRKVTPEKMAERLDRLGILSEPHPTLEECLIIRDGNPLHHSELNGLYYIQDPGSQAIGRLTGTLGGERILDACGAPGGKSISMLNVRRPHLHILNDLSLQRLRRTHSNLSLLGHTSIPLTCSNLDYPPYKSGSFDTVILDLPCSSTGTIGKNPEVRWRLKENDFSKYGDRQRLLLNRGLDLLTRGGHLIYATCSLEPEENEEVLFTVLNDRSDCTISTYKTLPVDYITSLVDSKGVIRILPDKTSSGFTFFILTHS